MARQRITKIILIKIEETWQRRNMNNADQQSVNDITAAILRDFAGNEAPKSAVTHPQFPIIANPSAAVNSEVPSPSGHQANPGEAVNTEVPGPSGYQANRGAAGNVGLPGIPVHQASPCAAGIHSTSGQQNINDTFQHFNTGVPPPFHINGSTGMKNVSAVPMNNTGVIPAHFQSTANPCAAGIHSTSGQQNINGAFQNFNTGVPPPFHINGSTGIQNVCAVPMNNTGVIPAHFQSTGGPRFLGSLPGSVENLPVLDINQPPQLNMIGNRGGALLNLASTNRGYLHLPPMPFKKSHNSRRKRKELVAQYLMGLFQELCNEDSE